MYVFPRSILVLQLSWCNLLPAALRFVFLKEDSGLFPHCLSAPPSFSAFLLLSCPQASAWVWSMGGNARRWKVKGERHWVVSPHHTHILPALLWASVLSLPDCSSSWEGWSSTLQLPQPQPLTPSDSISSLCHPDLQVVAAFLLLLSPDLQHPWTLPIPPVPSLRLQSTCGWILSPDRSWPKTTFRITLFIVFNSAFCPVNWHFPFWTGRNTSWNQDCREKYQ